MRWHCDCESHTNTRVNKRIKNWRIWFQNWISYLLWIKTKVSWYLESFSTLHKEPKLIHVYNWWTKKYFTQNIVEPRIFYCNWWSEEWCCGLTAMMQTETPETLVSGHESTWAVTSGDQWSRYQHHPLTTQTSSPASAVADTRIYPTLAHLKHKPEIQSCILFFWNIYLMLVYNKPELFVMIGISWLSHQILSLRKHK